MDSPFERLTALARAMFGTPHAMVGVVDGDRTIFRANVGLGLTEMPREQTATDLMVSMGPDAVLVIEDSLSAEGRMRDHPMVNGKLGLRFFAGVTIANLAGEAVGAIGVMDVEPRARPSDAEIENLKVLARMAAEMIDQAETGRRQSEQLKLLKLAEEMAGVGQWRLDFASGKVAWSDEVYRIYGHEPGAGDPTELYARGGFHPDDNAMLGRLVERAVLTGEGYETRLRLNRADGMERVTITKAQCEFGEDGRPTALFGVFQDITDSVAAHEQLTRSEALFRMMSETSTDIIARYKPDGEFLYLSPSVESVLGRTPESLLGRKAADIIHPEDVTDTYAQIAACAAAGSDAKALVEYRALHADGSIVWLEASPRAIRADDGRIVEMHDHVRDITEHKTAQREQTEMVETLKLAESMAGVGQWRWDVLANVVTWSDEVYRIHGVDAATFNPSLNSVVESYHPDDRPTLEAMIGHTLATGEGYEFQFRIIRPDGAERIVESRARGEIDGQGRVHALFGVVQDVTDRERAVEHIQHSEARYRLLAERSSDIITMTGVDGIFTYVSPVIETALGYRPEELVGRLYTDFVHPDDVSSMKAAFIAYVAAGPGAPSPRMAWRTLKKNGEMVWFEGHPRLTWDANGRPVEIQDLLRDITDTKRLEAELLEARDRAHDAARAKSEFLANMSHELRTPLTSVVGFSGLLQQSPTLGETERRYADRIGTASEALLGVINDILDYSKLEAGAVEMEARAFDPRVLVQAAAAMVEGQCEVRGLTLAVVVDPKLPAALTGDESRLRQVMVNFLANAAKFTAKGRVSLEASWTGERLRVAVTDTGIGIAAEKIDALFERFSQADNSTTRVYGGTGLGLSISRRLVETMDGEIGAESRIGEGSTFWFEVPLTPAEALASEEWADDETASPDGLRILMADDAAANRELVVAILGGMGVALETVEDGAQAVEAARGGAYDLILMDVHMPVMDGLDATRAIRALDGKAGRVPIIALTANVQPEQVLRCREAGMDDHVGKPIQVAELLRVIAARLEQRASLKTSEAA